MLAEGADVGTPAACFRPLRRLRRHLPLAGEDRVANQISPIARRLEWPCVPMMT
jgi:hypothetical protein